MPALDPVILFFLLGLAAGALRSDLKIPGVLYESISIFLLLAIGLKGGVALAQAPLAEVAGQAAVVVAAGALIPLVAFPVLRRLGGMSKADAGSIAGHYGSVSVVTFAVASAHLTRQGEALGGQLTVFLVLLEFPALVIGILLARWGNADTPWGRVLHEAITGKSLVLLLGGLLIGWVAGPQGIQPLDRLFFDLFKGLLAFFLLEMGLVAAARLGEVRRAGLFLLAFATLMPLASAGLGLATAALLGLGVGDATMLATLYASASYIAAPATMRIALPQANPALSIGASLGVTFPFNLFAGIPLYHAAARAVLPAGG